MGVYLEDLTYTEILPILARTGKLIDTRKIIEIDQEDEEAVLFLVRMRKAMREGKSLREFLDGEKVE